MSKNLSLTFREMLPPIVAEELDQLLVRLNAQTSSDATSTQASLDTLTNDITALQAALATLTSGVELVAHKGQPSGYAGLTTGGFVPIAQGGTGSSASLVNGRVMVSSAGAIVENVAGTLHQLLHGDLSWAIAEVAAGGTGLVSYAVGDILYASATTTLSKLADVATGNALISGGITTAPSWGKIGLTTHVSGVLPEVNGGTNQSTYTQGDLLYASAANTLSKLADVATGNALISGGIGGSPSWGKIGLTTHVSGVLAEGNGGTNQSTYTTGDILYASAANTLSKLAGQITTTRKFLRQTGNGAVSAAPVWDTILAADIPGSALTAGNDTNVTLTTGGTPATALLVAASITAGWTGTLAVSRGGIGVGTLASNGVLYGNGTGAVQALAVQGSGNNFFLKQILSAAPSWVQLDAGDIVTGTLAVARGGTNIGSYAIGDLLYASASGVLSKLADVAAGSYLRSGGVTTAPVWSTATLPNTATLGDVLYASATNVYSNLAKNTTATRYLSNTGASNVPAWAQINIPDGLTIASQATGDIIYASSATVWARLAIGASTTVLHGGTTPAYSAVSLTADVSGTLPVGNGGTGTATAFTAGSVVFAGASGVYTQKNANFFWDNTNFRLGIGTTSPAADLQINSNNAGDLFLISNSQNGACVSRLQNTNAGASAFASFHIDNDARANLMTLRGYSNAAGSTFPDISDSVLLRSNGAGGLTLSAQHASGVVRVSTGGTTEIARFDASGNFGIATASPSARFDLSTGAQPGMIIGADSNLTTRTNNTEKIGAFASYPYANAGQKVAIFLADNDGTNNYVLIGGGLGGLDAATLVKIFTGATASTNAGTVAVTVKSNQTVQFNQYGAGTATFDASGNITSVSDERMKCNLRPFTTGLKTVLAIEPIVYQFNALSGCEQEHEYIGFSAQQLQKVFPEIVYVNPTTGILSIWEQGILAALVNVVKEGAIAADHGSRDIQALIARVTALEQTHK